MSDTKPVLDAEIVEPNQEQNKIAPYELNRLGAFNPRHVVNEAVEIANALAKVITEQELYTVIKNKKYVHLEGWSIIGGMMGVVPIEESVTPIEGGYEAKVKLIRIRDNMQVGGASSICARSEQLWSGREEYAIRSMAITRATSKAYRLSYGWIIKLSGFDPLPTEEAGQLAMVEAHAAYLAREAEQLPKAVELQQKVAKDKIAEHEAKKAATTPQNAPESQETASTVDFGACVDEVRAGDAQEPHYEPLPAPEGFMTCRIDRVGEVITSKGASKKQYFDVCLGGETLRCFDAKLRNVFAAQLGKEATFKANPGKGGYGPTLAGVTAIGDADLSRLEGL